MLRNTIFYLTCVGKTGNFMLQNVAYRPTVYKTGVNAVQFGKIFWHTPKTLLFYKENLMTSIFQTPRLLPDFAPLRNTVGKKIFQKYSKNLYVDQYQLYSTFQTIMICMSIWSVRLS